MSTIEAAESTAKGLRQIIQDLVAPELRELKADVRGLGERMDRMDKRLDRLENHFERLEQLVATGFENLRRQLDTYGEVQLLKERMARVEGERSANLQPSEYQAGPRPL